MMMAVKTRAPCSVVRSLAEEQLLFLTPPALAELDKLDAKAIN